MSMLTRRKMLIGTAASSIAAIASDKGATAAPSNTDQEFFSNNLCSVGQLDGGALGAFHKLPSAFNLFIKWSGSAAEAFYKPRLNGGVDFFIKFFDKGWSPVSSIFLKQAANLENAEDAFVKL